jgi:hypothetical protein
VSELLGEDIDDLGIDHSHRSAVQVRRKGSKIQALALPPRSQSGSTPTWPAGTT